MPTEPLVVSRHADEFESAAVLADDALHGRQGGKVSDHALYFHRIFSNAIYMNTYRLGTVLLLFLGFLSGPSSGGPTRFADNVYRPLLLVVEVLCLALFYFDTFLQYKYYGRAAFVKKDWIRIKVVCIALFTIDWIIQLAVPTFPRFVRCLWPIMFIERNLNIRKIVLGFFLFNGINDANCTPWSVHGKQIKCSTFINDDCTNYFTTLGQTGYHLFILLTTANFPDVMLPVYQCSHWSAWFFVVYLILGLYFFINMVVAVTYAEYQSNTQQQTMSRYQRMMLGLHNAFNKLTSTARARQRIRDQSGRLKQSSKTSARLRQSKSGRRGPGKFADLLDGDGWVKFMHKLRPDISEEGARVLFKVMDEQETGVITEDEFQQLVYHVSHIKLVRLGGDLDSPRTSSGGDDQAQAPQEVTRAMQSLEIDTSHMAGAAPPAATPRGCASRRAAVGDWLRSNLATGLFDSVVALSSVFIIGELSFEQDGNLETKTTVQQVFGVLEYITLAIFGMEVLLKLIFVGPINYWSGTTRKLSEAEAAEDSLKAAAGRGRTVSVSINPVGAAPVPGRDNHSVAHSAGVSTAASHDRGASVGAGAGSGSGSGTGSGSGAGGEEAAAQPSAVTLLKRAERGRADSAGSEASTSSIDAVPPIRVAVHGNSTLNMNAFFNKLDIIVFFGTAIGLAMSVIEVWSQSIIILITLVRMLRLFRVFRVINGFTVTLFSLAHSVPAILRYMAVIFAVLYAFAAIGVELFAGKLVASNAAVAASAYGVNDYYVNNFDDLRNSFVVLFEQLIVNNWPIVMEGCVAATTIWARLYFFIFYVCSVVAVLSVLLAFMLDVFNHSKQQQERIDRGERVDYDKVALFAESGIDFSGWEFEVATKSSHSALVAELYKGAIGQEFWWATARRLSHRIETHTKSSVISTRRSQASIHEVDHRGRRKLSTPAQRSLPNIKGNSSRGAMRGAGMR